MYKPKVSEGGRGWILALLLRSPQYLNAALTLGIYHRRCMLRASVGRQSEVAAVIQQGKYLEVCMDLLHQSTQNACAESGLGIAFAVLQLVYYEVISLLT